MPIRRAVLIAFAALIALACAASSAHAGAMTLHGTVKGAGQITAVAGGTFECDHRGHELETDEATCGPAFYNAVFAVSLTLKAIPQTGWKRASWEGCDSVNDKNECVITGPITNRGTKDVKAVFEDVTGPGFAWDLQRHNGNGTATLEWHADEAATYRCTLNKVSYWDCSSPYTHPLLPEGTSLVFVDAIDRNGAVTSVRSDYFTDVQTTIAGAPAGKTNRTDATLTLGTPGKVDGYECKLDDGPWTECGSPWKLTGLADGQHVAAVRGHRAGTYEILPEARTWTVDTAAPQTSITGSPEPGSTTSSPTANVWLASTEPGRIECRIDAGAWDTCLSNKTYGDLADGPHTFEARAIDEAGNVDATPATRSWTVDTTAPATTITGGPADGWVLDSGTDVTFGFAADGPATFSCRLDDGAWEPCASPRTLKGLGAGPHVFAVRATDAVGNVEAAGASRSFTVAKPREVPGDKPGTGTAGAGTAAAGGASGGSTPSGSGTGTAPQPAAPRSSATASTSSPTRPRLVGRVKGLARVDRRGRLTIPGLKAECPAGGVCTVTTSAAGRVSGRATATMAAARTGAVRLRIGAGSLKRLPAGRRVMLRIKVSVAGPGGTVARTVAVAVRHG